MPGTFFSQQNTRFSSNQLDAPYTEYIIAVSYRTDLGRLMLPVAPQGSGVYPSEIVQTRLPTTVKVVSWNAERTGAHPVVPNPFVTDSNLILADYEFTPVSRRLDADGVGVHYRMSGVYTYYCRTPPVSLYYPGSDFDTASLGDNIIGTSDFGDNLVA